MAKRKSEFLTKEKRWKHNHPVLFAIIISFAVISFWRGIWGLMDIYLLPDNYNLSLWFSLILGLVILAGTNYITKELI